MRVPRALRWRRRLLPHHCHRTLWVLCGRLSKWWRRWRCLHLSRQGQQSLWLLASGCGADRLKHGTCTAPAAHCTRHRIRVRNERRELAVERHLRGRRVALCAAARRSHSDNGAVNGAASGRRLTATADSGGRAADPTAHRTGARERRARRGHERAGARVRSRVSAAVADRQIGRTVDTRRRLRRRRRRRRARVARRGARSSAHTAETALRAARTRRAAFARHRRVREPSARRRIRWRRRHEEAIERSSEPNASCVRCGQQFGHL